MEETPRGNHPRTARKFGAGQARLIGCLSAAFPVLIGHHAGFPRHDSALSHYIPSSCISIILLMTPPGRAGISERANNSS